MKLNYLLASSYPAFLPTITPHCTRVRLSCRYRLVPSGGRDIPSSRKAEAVTKENKNYIKEVNAYRENREST